MGRIAGYLLWAFGITWTIAAIGYAAGVHSTEHRFYIVLGALCMLGPASAAIIRQRLFDRAPWAGLGLPLKGTNWMMLAATAGVGLLIVPSYFLVVGCLGGSFREVSITHARFATAVQELLAAAGKEGTEPAMGGLLANVPGGVILLILLFAALVSALTINLPFMLGEELGWRGYLWQHTRHWQGFRRVLFTGVVWGLWHAPLILMGHNYPGHPLAGVGMMVLFCTVLAFLFDWSRARSGSIWSSCVLHGIINGSAGATMIFSWGGHPLLGSVAGVGGCIAIAGLVVVVLLLDRKYRTMLFRPGTPGATLSVP